jgi:hypothetical protein
VLGYCLVFLPVGSFVLSPQGHEAVEIAEIHNNWDSFLLPYTTYWVFSSTIMHVEVHLDEHVQGSFVAVSSNVAGK